jgi:putative membrane protein
MLVDLANYLLYFVATIVMLLVAIAIYVKVTPYDELALVRNGNSAAAVALAGTMIGYAAVVYSAIAHGRSFGEMAFWSAISLVTQIVAFEIVNLCFRNFKAEMEKGDLAYGIVLGGFSIAVGFINAGCLT